jgi:hypothetical protein
MGHPPLLIRPAVGAAPAPPDGVTVSEVRDDTDLGTWDRILATGYPMPRSPAPPALLGGATRFLLASVDGRPAATALSYAAHGVLNIEAIATLTEDRGRGLGAAGRRPSPNRQGPRGARLPPDPRRG